MFAFICDLHYTYFCRGFFFIRIKKNQTNWFGWDLASKKIGKSGNIQKIKRKSFLLYNKKERKRKISACYVNNNDEGVYVCMWKSELYWTCMKLVYLFVCFSVFVTKQKNNNILVLNLKLEKSEWKKIVHIEYQTKYTDTNHRPSFVYVCVGVYMPSHSMHILFTLDIFSHIYIYVV